MVVRHLRTELHGVWVPEPGLQRIAIRSFPVAARETLVRGIGEVREVRTRWGSRVRPSHGVTRNAGAATVGERLEEQIHPLPGETGGLGRRSLLVLDPGLPV